MATVRPAIEAGAGLISTGAGVFRSFQELLSPAHTTSMKDLAINTAFILVGIGLSWHSRYSTRRNKPI